MPLLVDKAKQTMFKMDSILHLGKKEVGKIGHTYGHTYGHTFQMP